MTAHLAALGVEPALRDGLIAAHAISGAAAFILGALLAARSGSHPVQSSLYVTALTLIALFVTGAVILDWHSLSPATRGIFTALLALAAYGVARMAGPEEARRRWPLAPGRARRPRLHIDHPLHRVRGHPRQ